ncbi:MAG: Uma2 family endonuclease [Gammaproteobacteria bacterium]|nr:Uma2 family endonuclease [Gammaproteobacteria bacterium]
MSPSYNHSYLAYRIARLLDHEEKFNFHIGITLDIDGNDYIPDIAVYEKKEIDFLHDKVKADERPLMVVEILSPKQGVNEVTEKIEVYLRAGIKSCWMVIPPAKTIVIFHDINKPVSYSSGILTDWILNMEIPVEEIFK